MMYINDISCISPQNTFGRTPFEGGIKLYSNKYIAIEPDYKNFLSKKELRRLSKISRLGIGAGYPLIERNSNLDGIIIGTSNGALNSSVKFLDQIIQYNEGTLTPTDFIQSTANSVSGTLALMSKNTGYNATYSSDGLAFESALLDALMHIEEGSGVQFLVGNTDEIADYNYNIDANRGLFKDIPVNSLDILYSNSVGYAAGEGSAMFIVSNKSQNRLAIIKDVCVVKSHFYAEIETYIEQFLVKNNLSSSDIATLILGLNGNVEEDKNYHDLMEYKFKNQSIISFKNLVGEYASVTGFALWLASQQNPVPSQAVYRRGKLKSENILIYNHNGATNHSFILVSNQCPLIVL